MDTMSKAFILLYSDIDIVTEIFLSLIRLKYLDIQTDMGIHSYNFSYNQENAL